MTFYNWYYAIIIRTHLIFLGGNGYISVYLFGVIIGNIKFSKRRNCNIFQWNY